jgi:hypothetical protein
LHIDVVAVSPPTNGLPSPDQPLVEAPASFSVPMSMMWYWKMPRRRRTIRKLSGLRKR